MSKSDVEFDYEALYDKFYVERMREVYDPNYEKPMTSVITEIKSKMTNSDFKSKKMIGRLGNDSIEAFIDSTFTPDSFIDHENESMNSLEIEQYVSVVDGTPCNKLKITVTTNQHFIVLKEGLFIDTNLDQFRIRNDTGDIIKHGEPTEYFDEETDYLIEDAYLFPVGSRGEITRVYKNGELIKTDVYLSSGSNYERIRVTGKFYKKKIPKKGLLSIFSPTRYELSDAVDLQINRRETLTSYGHSYRVKDMVGKRISEYALTKSNYYDFKLDFCL